MTRLLLVVALALSSTVASAQTITLTTESKEAKASFLEGLLNRQIGDNDEARGAYARAVAADPEFALARAMAAEVDAAVPPAERVARMDAEVSALASSPSELLLLLAYREWLGGQVHGDWSRANTNANQLFDALRRVAPDSPFAAWGFAQTRQSWLFGEWERDRAYREAIDRFPNHAPTYNNYAYRMARQGNLPEARRAIAKMVELVPNSPNAWDSFAEITQWSGLLTESIALFEKARSLGRPSALDQIADVQQIMGNGPAARQTLLESLEQAPFPRARLPVLRALGYSNLRDGHLEEGMARFEQVVREASEAGYPGWAAFANRELGLMDVLLRDGSRADGYFDSAEALEPGPNGTWFQAWAYALDGRFEEVREAIQEHRNAFPGEANEQWNQTLTGLLRFAEGDVGGAVDALKATNLSNDYATALLAIAYGTIGDAAGRSALEGQVRGRFMVDLPAADHNLPTLILDHLKLPGGSN